MFYFIKRKYEVPQYQIIEAKCRTWKRWTKFSGGYSYEYYGINDDKDKEFTTDDIIAKSKSKNVLLKKYASELI